jgi:succinylglutamate desuccinylase
MSPHIVNYIKGKKQQPLVILLGGIHGNEPSGIQAIEMVFRNIGMEMCQGSILGLRGNLAAIKVNRRFIVTDLNRLWTPANVYNALQDPSDTLSDDEQSLRGLVQTINQFVDDLEPCAIYFLDMHTTSSDGGIFAILTDDKASIDVARKLALPCVYDLLKNVSHSALNYMQAHDWGVPCYAMAFEAGHHKDPFSVYRHFAVAMRFIIQAEISEQDLTNHQYDHMLDIYMTTLPKSVSAKYRYGIGEARLFAMKPGFKHYSPIKKGEIVARYNGEYVYAPMDGLILMPLYQKQGGDGFFIVQEIL